MKLAVFDCDGTLIDSQINIIRAMEQSFQRHALPAPDPHAVRRVVGLSLVESMQVLMPGADHDLHLSMANDYKTAFQRLRADKALDAEPLYPGISALLATLAAQGWLLAVASAARPRLPCSMMARNMANCRWLMAGGRVGEISGVLAVGMPKHIKNE